MNIGGWREGEGRTWYGDACETSGLRCAAMRATIEGYCITYLGDFEVWAAHD